MKEMSKGGDQLIGLEMVEEWSNEKLVEIKDKNEDNKVVQNSVETRQMRLMVKEKKKVEERGKYC